MLYTVEVRHIGAELAAATVEMRTWLDYHGIKPTEFDHSSGGPGITFRLGFRREDQARAFAEAFRGWFKTGDPNGATLWRIIEPPPTRDRLQVRGCDRAQGRGSARDG